MSRGRTRGGEIEKRLARAQRERRTRARRPRHTSAELPARGRSLARNLLLFATSLVAGALLAHSASKGTPQRWNGQSMALHTISVLGNERLTSAEIAEMTGLPRQADLAEVPLRDLEERIARHPWIRTARVAVLPTGTLIVDVEEREVHAIVRAAHGGPARLLDAECVPFAPAPHELTVAVDALPTLRSRAPVEMGRADPQLCEALALTELLREFAGSDHGLRPFDSASASFVSFEVLLPDPHSDLGWTLHEPSGRSVVLGNAPRDDMKERLGRLARLLDSGIGAVARASTIDLRFADQAVLRGLAPRKQVPTRRRPSADAQRRPSRGERAIRRSAQGGRT